MQIRIQRMTNVKRICTFITKEVRIIHVQYCFSPLILITHIRFWLRRIYKYVTFNSWLRPRRAQTSSLPTPSLFTSSSRKAPSIACHPQRMRAHNETFPSAGCGQVVVQSASFTQEPATINDVSLLPNRKAEASQCKKASRQEQA